MDRDETLILHILQEVAGLPVGETLTNLAVSATYPPLVVYDHVQRLIDEQLVQGTTVPKRGGLGAFQITGLTQKGQDYLAAIR